MFNFQVGIRKGDLEILFCGRGWGRWNLQGGKMKLKFQPRTQEQEAKGKSLYLLLHQESFLCLVNYWKQKTQVSVGVGGMVEGTGDR